MAAKKTKAQKANEANAKAGPVPDEKKAANADQFAEADAKGAPEDIEALQVQRQVRGF